MLKIENTEVCAMEAAIRGARNAMNSWHRMDSQTVRCGYDGWDQQFVVGSNDLDLMKRLAAAGPDHAKYLRYVEVYVDIEAPLYFWKEFKTYRKNRKFLDDGDEFLDPNDLELHIETNSCSTMHKIHAKEFTLDDFSHEHLKGLYLKKMKNIITMLNDARAEYLESKDKDDWWQMIQLLPSSYNQRRTVKLNYQVLKNMYFARRNHKLDEWHTFCDWTLTLPYFKEVCVDVMEGKK